MVKKTLFKDYDTPIRADGIIAINIRKGDELVRVRMTSGKDDIIMVSKSGHAARFSEKQARPMGRATAGVKGMNVSDKGNRVLSLDVIDHSDTKGDLLVVTENGYGKRTALAEYPVKGRGAKGMLTARLTAKKGGLAGARVVREGQELIFISQNGMVQRNAVDGISRMGRATQGVRVMNLKKGDRVSAVALVVESENGDGNGTAAKTPSLEDEAPDAASVADEAAAAEAAGNGEAKVTKRSADSKPAAKPKRRSSESASKPKKASAKPKPVAKPKPAPKKRSSGGSASAPKAKASRAKVKPKHTATAKQRAEAERKKRK
jgi:DNA gyrase subunit A